MADERLPELDPVVTPALTDIHAVRQSGDTRDKRETLAQALSLAVSFPEFQFEPHLLDNPNSADWAINALAPAVSDNINSGLTVRRFDDTTEEGIGFFLEVPAGATDIVFGFVSRAISPQPTPNNIGVNIYNRGIPDDAAVQAWSAGDQLTDLALPNSTNFVKDSESVTLASLGITAGETTQFELTRIAPTGGDNQFGDWALLQLKVSFT